MLQVPSFQQSKQWPLTSYHWSHWSLRPDYLFAPESESIRPTQSLLYYNRWSLFRQFFSNYLLISMQKKIHSFCSTLNIYLLVVHTKKIIIHSFWATFVKDPKRNFSCQIYKNPHKNSKKVGGFFCTNAKVHEMTKMLYKCANNLFFNELRIKC